MFKQAPGLLAFVAITEVSSAAAAQVDLSERRSDSYYAAHAATIGGLFAASLAMQSVHHRSAGADPEWFPGDRSLRGRYSRSAALVSNVPLVLAIVDPMLVGLSRGANYRFLNASVAYTEALAAAETLNATAKVAFSRPRPYTYALDTNGARGVEASLDFYVSFYSGHSSSAFTSAVAGSYVYAEVLPTREWRWLLWGSEFAFASATANLRVRAGKHYYSDVAVGAMAGSVVGIAIPWLHGVRYSPEPGEYIAAGAGLGLGILVSQLFPFSSSPTSAHTVGQPLREVEASAHWPPKPGVAVRGSF